MSTLLFVYGTLMPAARHPKGAQLARESRLVGPATMAGRLHDLGRYPGLVSSENEEGIVHGEIVALTTPEATWPWLDAYEGYVPGDPAGSEYERIECPARLADGAMVTAWVYVYRRTPPACSLIASGRWLDRR